MTELSIAGRNVGPKYPPLVIAEIGINHGGDVDIAIAMADAALDCGAEIIKHQTHICEDEMSREAKATIPSHTTDSIYTIMERCALNEAEEFKLMQHITSRNGIFFSSPFSRLAADRLMDFDVPAFKIGSGECNNYPLVSHIASFGRPVIMSTGMNTLETIEPAVNIFRRMGIPFALLHCTNVYPTPPSLVRLDAMPLLQERFPDAVVGLSDHTTSNFTSLGACALGASIIERHFTDTMSREGPDIACSMDPEALQQLIEGSRIIYEAKGAHKGPLEEEQATIAFAFASVVAIKDINVGEKLSPENIWVRRPSGGDFTPTDFESLMGRVAKKKIKKDARLRRSDIND